MTDVAEDILAAHQAQDGDAKDAEPVAFKCLMHLSGSAYAWTRWMDMDDQMLRDARSACWKIEYAYPPPQQEAQS